MEKLRIILVNKRSEHLPVDGFIYMTNKSIFLHMAMCINYPYHTIRPHREELLLTEKLYRKLIRRGDSLYKINGSKELFRVMIRYISNVGKLERKSKAILDNLNISEETFLEFKSIYLEYSKVDGCIGIYSAIYSLLETDSRLLWEYMDKTIEEIIIEEEIKYTPLYKEIYRKIGEYKGR